MAFARRQATWFRAEREIEWLDATEDPLPATLAAARELVSAASDPADEP